MTALHRIEFFKLVHDVEHKTSHHLVLREVKWKKETVKVITYNRNGGDKLLVKDNWSDTNYSIYECRILKDFPKTLRINGRDSYVFIENKSSGQWTLRYAGFKPFVLNGAWKKHNIAESKMAVDSLKDEYVCSVGTGRTKKPQVYDFLTDAKKQFDTELEKHKKWFESDVRRAEKQREYNDAASKRDFDVTNDLIEKIKTAITAKMNGDR